MTESKPKPPQIWASTLDPCRRIGRASRCITARTAPAASGKVGLVDRQQI